MAAFLTILLITHGLADLTYEISCHKRWTDNPSLTPEILRSCRSIHSVRGIQLFYLEDSNQYYLAQQWDDQNFVTRQMTTPDPRLSLQTTYYHHSSHSFASLIFLDGHPYTHHNNDQYVNAQPS
jgi:hypothetical protein